MLESRGNHTIKFVGGIANLVIDCPKDDTVHKSNTAILLHELARVVPLPVRVYIGRRRCRWSRGTVGFLGHILFQQLFTSREPLLQVLVWTPPLASRSWRAGSAFNSGLGGGVSLRRTKHFRAQWWRWENKNNKKHPL